MNEGEHLLQLHHQILQHITSLDLGMLCYIDHRGFENLAECVPYLCSLTSLNISESPGGVGSLVKLFQALRKHGKLQTLNMNHIEIGTDDVAALSDLIQPSSSLRELIVGDDTLPPEVYQQLVRTVFSPSSLETLLFLTTDDAYPLEYIQSISASITHLTFLTLSPSLPSSVSTSPSTNGSPFSSSTFSSPQSSSSSSSRSLSGNTSPEQSTTNPSRVKGGTKLSHILRENTSLKELKLFISLDGDEVRDVVHSLEDNHSLQTLELCKMWHFQYFSESEQETMDPRVYFVSNFPIEATNTRHSVRQM